MDQLVFRFGRWVGEVPVRTGPQTETERVDLAANLRADIGGDGFPVIRVTGDLQHGSGMSTSIVFGDAATPGTGQVELAVGFCEQPESDSGTHRRFSDPRAESALAWCDQQTGVHVDVLGPADFTATVADHLVLRGDAPR